MAVVARNLISFDLSCIASPCGASFETIVPRGRFYS
jgi:hypothetical protein